MKIQNWWVKEGLLTSSLNPEAELLNANENFFAEADPVMFMVGDGHDNPPLQWATKGNWPAIFEPLVAANMICCHLEVYAGAAKLSDVPAAFAEVFHHGKVFGFEMEDYRAVQDVLDLLVDIRPIVTDNADKTAVLPSATMSHMGRLMWRVGQLGYLTEQAKKAMSLVEEHVTAAPVKRGRDILVNDVTKFSEFIRDYQREAVKLRIARDVHTILGANIQKVIQQFPGHMHLISIGDAHLLDKNNPFYNFVKPPVGTYGFVDPLK